MTDQASEWVLDASPLINLLATDRFREIAVAFPGEFVAVSQAVAEVRRHPLRVEPEPLAALVSTRVLSQVELHGAAIQTFVDLVGAPSPDDLGDGEAATIAYAAGVDAGVVLDDGKARRICRALFPSLEIISSLDLLRDAAVAGALGTEHADAIFGALRYARMRVFSEDREWVVALIGSERAAECPSLPNT